MPYLLSVLAITVIALVSAVAGIWLTSFGAFARRMVPFGGGVLVGVAIFWVMPELAQYFTWPGAIAWMAGGLALLWLFDRYVYAVCPACAPAHDHEHCTPALHGFALPLLVAAGLHSALDGWSVMAGGEYSSFGPALALAIAAHKVPEGMALGVIARASLDSRMAALAWCAAAQSMAFAGAGLESILAPHIGPQGLHAFLALAAGSFLYLGGHAIHGELQRHGPAPAFFPALTGVAGSSVLRLLVR